MVRGTGFHEGKQALGGAISKGLTFKTLAFRRNSLLWVDLERGVEGQQQRQFVMLCFLAPAKA